MANVRVEPDAARQRQHVIGTFGVVIAVSVAVILGVHPWGSTDLYDDGAEFVTLRTPAGQVFGQAGGVDVGWFGGAWRVASRRDGHDVVPHF
jgi:hypothetical protein